MRILIDTNILISALLFPKSTPAKALLLAAQRHQLVLCDRNVAELREVLNRKAPRLLSDADVLLAELSYELIPAVEHAEKDDGNSCDQHGKPYIPQIEKRQKLLHHRKRERRVDRCHDSPHPVCHQSPGSLLSSRL